MEADPDRWDEKQLNRIYMTGIGRLLFDLWNVEGESGLEMLKQIGFPVTSAHLNVVPHIDIEGTRLTELARRAHLTKQSVWESLKNMEAHGYIERTRDPSDARAVLVTWTPKGFDFLRVVCLGVMIRENDVARRIGSRDAKTLKTLLTRLRESYAREPPDIAQLVAPLLAQRKRKQPSAIRRRTGRSSN